MSKSSSIRLPPDLVPEDGRFGSGPARVSVEALDALVETGTSFLGTSHRSKGMRSLVEGIKEGLSTLYDLPEGYEVILGVGGTTTFWDAAAHGLILKRSQHLVFGVFSSKFSSMVAGAPWLDEPTVIAAEPGSHPVAVADPDIDTYAMTHNETSTGVMMPVGRPGSTDALVLVDATSAAGASVVDPLDFDAYYFSPQKAFGSDGGLWLSLCSPAAIDRIQRIETSGRWIPPSLHLAVAVEHSRRGQTANTPGLATLFLLDFQIKHLIEMGGLAAAESHCRAGAKIMYDWADSRSFASPFVSNPAQRSHTTVTIDIEQSIPAAEIVSALAANGIVDLSGYRKLNRNQLRIGTYPNVTLDDLHRLAAAIDYVVERL